MELAHSKASSWAKVTAEDLGQCVQAFAIAMVDLVDVDEVEMGGVPSGGPPPGNNDCPRTICDWEEGDDDYEHIIREAIDEV